MKIKILQVVPTMTNNDGIASYVYNSFCNIDKKNIDISFAIIKDRSKDRYNDIEKNGGKIYELFRETNPIKYAKKIKKFFANNNFDIVHCHVSNVGLLFLYYAKKYGIKVRILHSHATVSADSWSHRLRNNLIIPFTRKYANVYFACSDAAGKALFGKRKYTVLNNGIDYSRFKFDKIKREKIRNELGLNDKVIVGNVGRLCNQKNQIFLIENIEEMDDDHHLLIIGNGPLKEKYEKIIEEKKLSHKVTFLESKNNIEEYYSALDALVLPSLYEGLPVVGIEAQVNGLKCIFSDKITKETDISGNVEFISILEKDSANKWMKNINDLKIDNKHKATFDNSYDIKLCSNKLKNIYEELLNQFTNENGSSK